MSRYRIAPLAQTDLDSIWDYIAADDIAAADRLLESFRTKLALIAEAPGLGRPRDEFARSLRSFPVGNYLLFYRPMADGIELVRVLHGARNLPPLFDTP